MRQAWAVAHALRRLVTASADRTDLRLLLPAGCGWVLLLTTRTVAPLSQLVIGALCATAAVLVLRPHPRHGRRTRRPLVDAGAVAAAGEVNETTDSLAAQVRGSRALGRRVDIRRRVAAGCLAACALTGCASGLHGLIADTGPLARLAGQSSAVRIEGVLAADPRPVTRSGPGAVGRPQLVVVRLRVHQVTARGVTSGSGGTVLVFADGAWMNLHWRDRVTVRGTPRPAEPGGDVDAVLGRPSTPVRTARAPVLLRGLEGVRADLSRVAGVLPADPAGLLPALVVGDVSAVPQRLTDDLRATGMTHLTAVSGANVTVLLLAVAWLCGWAGVPRRHRVWVCLLALGCFVLLCRPEPSVVRASAMGVVGLLGTGVGRPRVAAPALGAAVLALLVLDPHLASSYGFALSALATLGLILFARGWARPLADRLPERCAPLADALVVPLAAQATCAPVVVLLQGSVSLIGIPANILAAPLVAPATLGGIVTAVLAPWAQPVAEGVVWFGGLPAWGIAAIAHTAAGVPGGSLPWPGGASGAWLLAALILAVVLAGPWLLAERRRAIAAVGLVVAVTGAAWVPLPRTGAGQAWAYVACDVGQGDAGLLATGEGRAVLVDAGQEPDLVDDCLSRWGVDHLDAVVLTHFHADHVGGLSVRCAGGAWIGCSSVRST